MQKRHHNFTCDDHHVLHHYHLGRFVTWTWQSCLNRTCITVWKPCHQPLSFKDIHTVSMCLSRVTLHTKRQGHPFNSPDVHLRTAVGVLKTDLWSAWTKKADLAECRWCYSRQLTDFITSVPVGQVITRTKKQLHTAYYQTNSVQRQIPLTWDSQACPMVASITKMTLSGLYTNKRTSGYCSSAQQHFPVSAAKIHFKQGLSEQSEYSNHCDNNN